MMQPQCYKHKYNRCVQFVMLCESKHEWEEESVYGVYAE